MNKQTADRRQKMCYWLETKPVPTWAQSRQSCIADTNTSCQSNRRRRELSEVESNESCQSLYRFRPETHGFLWRPYPKRLGQDSRIQRLKTQASMLQLRGKLHSREDRNHDSLYVLPATSVSPLRCSKAQTSAQTYAMDFIYRCPSTT